MKNYLFFVSREKIVIHLEGSMKGTLYGVGVGPGDKELMTLKAVRIIRESDIIAVPKTGEGKRVALDIAADAVGDKPILELEMPMTRDSSVLNTHHDAAADAIAAVLERGKSVAFLTLGDVSLYSTFGYVQTRIVARGYAVELIPGIPAFCAVAAVLGDQLAEGNEPVRILPAASENAHALFEAVEEGENVVIMKVGRYFESVKQALQSRGWLSKAKMVERCSMSGEKIYDDIAEVDEVGYFTTMIIHTGRADQ